MKPKFQVGELLMIRPDISDSIRVPTKPPQINDEMRIMGGRVGTVKEAWQDEYDGSARYLFQDLSWQWREEWLQPLEELEETVLPPNACESVV